MPTGPKGEKRPADVIGNAVKVMRLATGEETEVMTDDGKNAAAVALGRMGGKARAAGMTAKKRSEIAKKAAKSRWGALRGIVPALHLAHWRRIHQHSFEAAG
ncbi:MAG: RNA-binding protein [Nitrobacter sp.]